jgi:Resolvase, N terminal domain
MRGGSPFGVRGLRWRGRRATAPPAGDASPRAGAPVLLRHPLFVSGTTGEGVFRGRAVAVAVDAGADLGADRTRYLVEGTGRGEPFWVHEADIERSYPLLPGDAVIGYVTVGPLERRSATRAAVAGLRATCRRAEWRLVGVICDNDSDPVAERPGLTRALERIAAREAAGLVVADLARAAGTDAALVSLLAAVRGAGGGFGVVEPDLPAPPADGARRAALSERAAAARRIAELRTEGLAPAVIAEVLDEEGFLTPGPDPHWRPWSVREVGGAWPPRGPRRPPPRPARRLPNSDW